MLTLNNKNIDELIFWLSYESDEYKERKNHLFEKRVKDCSFEEIKELLQYREYEHMIPLLSRYKTNNYSEDEFLEVREFLRRPMIDIMIDKTPKDILKKVKESLLELKDSTDFSEVIKKMPKKKDISIEDRFIRYVISEDRLHYLRSLREIDISLAKQKRADLKN